MLFFILWVVPRVLHVAADDSVALVVVVVVVGTIIIIVVIQRLRVSYFFIIGEIFTKIFCFQKGNFFLLGQKNPKPTFKTSNDYTYFTPSSVKKKKKKEENDDEKKEFLSRDDDDDDDDDAGGIVVVSDDDHHRESSVLAERRRGFDCRSGARKQLCFWKYDCFLILN